MANYNTASIGAPQGAPGEARVAIPGMQPRQLGTPAKSGSPATQDLSAKPRVASTLAKVTPIGARAAALPGTHHPTSAPGTRPISPPGTHAVTPTGRPAPAPGSQQTQAAKAGASTSAAVPLVMPGGLTETLQQAEITLRTLTPPQNPNPSGAEVAEAAQVRHLQAWARSQIEAAKAAPTLQEQAPAQSAATEQEAQAGLGPQRSAPVDVKV